MLDANNPKNIEGSSFRKLIPGKKGKISNLKKDIKAPPKLSEKKDPLHMPQQKIPTLSSKPKHLLKGPMGKPKIGHGPLQNKPMSKPNSPTKMKDISLTTPEKPGLITRNQMSGERTTQPPGATNISDQMSAEKSMEGKRREKRDKSKEEEKEKKKALKREMREDIKRKAKRRKKEKEEKETTAKYNESMEEDKSEKHPKEKKSKEKHSKEKSISDRKDSSEKRKRTGKKKELKEEETEEEEKNHSLLTDVGSGMKIRMVRTVERQREGNKVTVKEKKEEEMKKESS